MPRTGILVFEFGILPLEITALTVIVGAPPFKVTSQGLGSKVRSLPCIVRILKSVIGPKEYVSRALLRVTKTLAGKVGMLMFQVGTRVQGRNSEVQGQDTSVVLTLGILAGRFGTLMFGGRTLVPKWLFCGSCLLGIINASPSTTPGSSF